MLESCPVSAFRITVSIATLSSHLSLTQSTARDGGETVYIDGRSLLSSLRDVASVDAPFHSLRSPVEIGLVTGEVPKSCAELSKVGLRDGILVVVTIVEREDLPT